MRVQPYQKPNNPFVQLLILSLVLFGLAWLSIASLTFFINDIGFRYLQIRMLVVQQWQSLAIPSPAGIDPYFEHTPYYYAYSLVNGRLFFNISPIFPLLGSFLFVLWGKAGLVATLVIGSLMAGWGIYSVSVYADRAKRPFGQTLKQVAILLILASIILQGLGIRHAYSAVAEEVEYREQIDALPANVIVTNHPFLQSFMTSLENKTFFYVKNGADLLSLLPQFESHDIRHNAVLPIESGDLTLPNQIDGLQIQKTGTAVYELQSAQN